MNYSLFYELGPVPASMPLKEAKRIRQCLIQLRDTATMETANFSRPDLKGSVEMDKAIKDMTKLWRESWLIDPLNAMIERYESWINEKES